MKLILPHNRLLINELEKTNDPRENKSLNFGHTTTLPKQFGDLIELNKQYTRIVRSGSKVLCFSQDYKNYWGCCLSKMWAHYGDLHKGVCLELDREAFIEENSSKYDFSLFQPIHYHQFDYYSTPKHKLVDHDSIARDGLEEYLKGQFRMDNLRFLFFTKNDEWESECEIRLLHFSEAKEMEFCSIISSLRNIHLGVNFNEDNVEPLKDLIRDRNVGLCRIEFQDVGLVHKPFQWPQIN